MIQLGHLEARTRVILGLAATGKTNDEIATRLGISHAEVDRHVRDAIAALSARSRLEAAVIARRLGLIHPSVGEPGHGLSVIDRHSRPSGARRWRPRMPQGCAPPR